MKVVVVESPSKAKTIHKYLGKDYKVLASYGHVRDLPAKNGSVDPEHHFKMVWKLSSRSQEHLQEIIKASKKADQLFLATDPDREGEAIAWHVEQVLKEKKDLSHLDIQRIVFYEVTPQAVKESLKHPRPIHQDLVDAYLARRSLDYLVGFQLSPILWRKLPGSRSAGRVQSVALRLVAEREEEIESFQSQEYWFIEGYFFGSPEKKVQGRLTYFQGEKLSKFSITTESEARAIVSKLQHQTYQVVSVEKKQVKRNPAPPFMTSTLQQEASRKLGFRAKKTMQIAQQLYEGINLGRDTVGLITYMRTDSLNIAQSALEEAQSYIRKTYGENYGLSAPRTFKSKAKNTQEAHEAIRPTSLVHDPHLIRQALTYDQAQLYDLIWKRFLASQMAQAIFDQVGINIGISDQSILFRATGSTLVFDGFLKVYEEGKDADPAADEADVDPLPREKERRLPPFSPGEALTLQEVVPDQHFTQPPPRYTEASLVKKMEELGIGRPSTYTTILATLLDRTYVKLEKQQLIPESLGRLVTVFLKRYFSKYVEYDFTAHLEEKLDDIAQGELEWVEILTDFWSPFKKVVEDAEHLKITDVLNEIEKCLEKFIFSSETKDENPRLCPLCKKGQLNLKLGKFGGFVGCSNYPECSYTRPLTIKIEKPEEGPLDSSENSNSSLQPFETKLLGTDPISHQEITLRKGPYGFYLQWGEATKNSKPKRISLPKGHSPSVVTLEQALSLGALPRTLGLNPKTGQPVQANIGRFGPYIKVGDQFFSLGKKGGDILTIELPEALKVVSDAQERALKRGKPLKKKESNSLEKSPKNSKKTSKNQKKIKE